MSNLKKIAIAISIFIIGILGLATITKATDIGFGNTVVNFSNDRDQFYTNPGIFCIDSSVTDLPEGEYNLACKIEISGKTARYGTKSWSDNSVAEVAYILNKASKKVMTNDDGEHYPDRLSTLRAFGWVDFPNWYKTAKNSLNLPTLDGLCYDFGLEDIERVNQEYGSGYNKNELSGAYNDLMNDADTYVKQLAEHKDIKKLGTDAITATVKEEADSKYMQIGPFRCEFSGKLEKITVNTDAGDKEPSGYVQQSKSVSIDKIESGKDFYINIKLDENITKINKITIFDKKFVIYGASIYVYDSKTKGHVQQDFVYFEKNNKGESHFVEYNYPISVKDAELQIKKIDTSGNNNVNGIGFKVYSQVEGKTGWLKIDSNRKITEYTTFEDASTLVTDSNGLTSTIIAMPVGKYSIYETNLGPHSYLYSLGTCEVPEGTNINEKITVTAKKIEEKDIYGIYTSKAENTPVYGALQINKVDEAGNALEGIGFKIYSHISGKEGWLVLDEDANLTGYAKTIDKVKNIYTDENGKTLIVAKLPAGKYTVYETDVGKYGDMYGLEEVEVSGGTKAYIVKNNVKDVTVEANGIANKEIVEVKNTPDLGSLIIHKEDNAGNPLSGIGFKIYSEVPEKTGWLNINNGTGLVESYVGKIEEVKYDLKTGSGGNTHIVTKLPAGKYKIYETSVGEYDDIYALTLTDVPGGTKAYVKNIGEVEVTATGTEEATLYTETNTPDLGSLKIKKIDKYTEETLPGIGFKVYSNLKGKEGWLTINSDNELTGYTTFANATEIFTQKDGITNIIEKLPAGEYGVYETNLGNYANTYKLEEIEVPGENKKVKAKFVENKTVEAKGTAESTLYEAENIPQLVNLSGYVWVDKQSQKQSVRNNLFNEDDNDDADLKLQGIKVILQQEELTGGGWMVGEDISNSAHYYTIAETTTDANGAYKFENIKVSDLSNSAIVFEYDGLTYTNVVPNLKKNNGSKAAENEYDREKFNNKFEKIEYDTTINGVKLEYDTKNNKSTFINNGQFKINANTAFAGLYLEKEYEEGRVEKNADGIPEIKNINLGLYERTQPELVLEKSIENVKVSVNGFEHLYKYDNLDANKDKANEEDFNVGVKYEKKYSPKTSYERPIYKSDYYAPNNGDKSKDLKVYITYKIKMGNAASDLTSRINSLVDYYDAQYDLVAVGRATDDKTGEVVERLTNITNSSYNDKYKKLDILETTEIAPNKAKYIYVQFSMEKETVGKILFDANGEERNDKILLNNVVEITSYSTFKDGKLYAGIDKNSRPGNATPGDWSTYEPDTDDAPALQLVVAEPRKITGTVFLDETSAELKIGQKRLGNGVYDEGETTIPGVEVKMLKEDGTVVATAITDENGEFELSEFAPGDYTIVYTWGDTTYRVQDYKGTIYNETSRMNDNKWYQQTDIRYSDAIDNYETRKSIDSGANITKMESTTPTMKFGVELNDRDSEGLINVTSGIDRVEFIIKNVDFGIVERPRQKLDISKNATAMKIILGNNMGTLDAKIEKDTNGNVILKGTGLEMLTATPQEETTKGALLWAQVDSDILQNSTIKIEYKISVANNSELDYDSEDYYKYGIPVGNKITMKPTGVYDYLDGTVLDTEKATENSNEGWKEISRAEYDNEFATEPTIIDQYLNKYSSTIVSPDGTITNIEGYEEFIAEHYDEIREYTVELVKELRETLVADKTILRNSNLENTLEPGHSNTVTLYTSQVLAVKDEIDFNNSAEIAKVERNTETGRIITPRDSALYDSAEEITVTPPTGENQDYILPIVLGVSTLIILGAGIVLIKKKVLNK